jgi:hypothetical protein
MPSRAVIVLAACAALALPAPATAVAPRVPRGPSGDAFYRPPAKRVPGRPGTVVWARRATGLPALPAAARTTTVVFRSRSLTGAPIAESGTVLVPKGAPPVGGWPIVSWSHVTTGAADSCAPSRATPGNPELERLTRSDAIVALLLGAGVAVARPDGEGIGTRGGHPYLIGRSLARSQVDIVRAARRIDRRIGRRWAAAGHSEGGVSTLFSAALGQRLAPELDLRAAAAFAPVTRVRDLLNVFRLDPLPGPPGDGLSALASLIITGAALADPAIARSLRAGGLSERAAALLGHVDRRCLVELTRPDSWGGIPPAAIPGPRYEQDVRAAFERVLDENDFRHLDLGRLPVRIDQGLSDLVAPAVLTAASVLEQRARGADITYEQWPTATHVDITSPAQAARAAVGWLVARLH